MLKSKTKIKKKYKRRVSELLAVYPWLNQKNAATTRALGRSLVLRPLLNPTPLTLQKSAARSQRQVAKSSAVCNQAVVHQNIEQC